MIALKIADFIFNTEAKKKKNALRNFALSSAMCDCVRVSLRNKKNKLKEIKVDSRQENREKKKKFNNRDLSHICKMYQWELELKTQPVDAG